MDTAIGHVCIHVQDVFAGCDRNICLVENQFPNGWLPQPCRSVPGKVELAAYTGVAAFNVGFGARAISSAFQIFPDVVWKGGLDGPTLPKVEDAWQDVLLLIVDGIAFIGAALSARIHIRLTQGRRAHFSQRGSHAAGLPPDF